MAVGIGDDSAISPELLPGFGNNFDGTVQALEQRVHVGDLNRAGGLAAQNRFVELLQKHCKSGIVLDRHNAQSATAAARSFELDLEVGLTDIPVAGHAPVPNGKRDVIELHSWDARLSPLRCGGRAVLDF